MIHKNDETDYGEKTQAMNDAIGTHTDVNMESAIASQSTFVPPSQSSPTGSADTGAQEPFDDECVTPSEPEGKAQGKHIGAVVYFSSVSNNTARFIESCGFPEEGINVYRIPLRPKETPLQVREPYILVVPTYGGGDVSKALLPQIRKFLNGHKNRSFIRGVISSGNRNFATAFCAAGDIIAEKCHVPFMYNFELLGTADDQRQVREGVRDFFLNTQSSQAEHQ
jgi:protein involved in ribonucleotide reduction